MRRGTRYGESRVFSPTLHPQSRNQRYRKFDRRDPNDGLVEADATPTGARWLIRKFLPPSDRHRRRRRRRRRLRREASLIVTFGYNARRNKFVAGAVHN